MAKDWNGNYNSVFKTLGASSHTKDDREENDYYATDPTTLIPLLKKEKINHDVWECACGEGHLSKELINNGFQVKSTDLINRGYGVGGVDFLKSKEKFNGDILTNPPYKYALEFVEHALEIINTGNKVIMFLKLQFLEGQERRRLFDTMQLSKVYVFSKRQQCAKNGIFTGSSAVAYAWFVWIKGYKDLPKIEWIDDVNIISNKEETENKKYKQYSIFDY